RVAWRNSVAVAGRVRVAIFPPIRILARSKPTGNRRAQLGVIYSSVSKLLKTKDIQTRINVVSLLIRAVCRCKQSRAFPPKDTRSLSSNNNAQGFLHSHRGSLRRPIEPGPKTSTLFHKSGYHDLRRMELDR